MSKLRTIAPAALLAVAVAACGPVTSSGSPDDGATPSASTAPASTAPSASGAASPAASGSAAASASPSASAATGGGDPASLIPATVGDVALSVTETDAEAYIGANINRQLTPILTTLGKTPADVTVATATGSAAGGATLFIDAVQIAETDAEALVTAFQTAAAAVPGSSVAASDVGGQPAVTVTTPSYVLAVTASGDTLFYVQSPNAELVTQALEAVAA